MLIIHKTFVIHLYIFLYNKAFFKIFFIRLTVSFDSSNKLSITDLNDQLILYYLYTFESNINHTYPFL